MPLDINIENARPDPNNVPIEKRDTVVMNDFNAPKPSRESQLIFRKARGSSGKKTEPNDDAMAADTVKDIGKAEPVSAFSLEKQAT